MTNRRLITPSQPSRAASTPTETSACSAENATSARDDASQLEPQGDEESADRESSTPINQSKDGGADTRKGDENLETGTSETGAVPTFSGSREKEGGSDQVDAPAAEVQPEGPLTDGLIAQAVPFDDQPKPRRITRAGWMDVLPTDGDLGSGFYRFAAKDIEGLPERSPMAQTIECFGKDLAAAQYFLTALVAKARKVSVSAQPRLTTRPVAFRPTRLCKRARHARGEV